MSLPLIGVSSDLQRQDHIETRPVRRPGFHANGPVVSFDDGVGNGEAQADAAPDLTRGEEGLENLARYVRRDSRPGILHRDRERVGVASGGQHDAAASIDRLRGIAEQIDEHLSQSPRVAADPSVRSVAPHYLDPGVELVPKQRNRGVEKLPDILFVTRLTLVAAGERGEASDDVATALDAIAERAEHVFHVLECCRKAPQFCLPQLLVLGALRMVTELLACANARYVHGRYR